MAVMRSLTLWKVPRRMRRWVMSRNQRSTMLSQEPTGGDEVQVEAWMPLQPALHRRALVRAVVVDDEMQSQLRRRLAVDAGQEADELPATMARQTLANDLAVEQAEGRKQRRRAMARVIMRLPGGDAGTQRQQRRRSVQGLNLALLVHRQHQGLVGWIQVQAHDIPELLHEVRVAGQLEGLHPMGLQAVLLPDAL